MITRITRAVLDVDREAEVFESLRKSTASRPQLPGLISFSLSRMLRDLPRTGWRLRRNVLTLQCWRVGGSTRSKKP
jgi:hypothetical protein